MYDLMKQMNLFVIISNFSFWWNILLFELSQSAEKNEHLFGVDRHDLIPDTEDKCIQLSGYRDDVFGIVLLSFLSFSVHHDIPVDSSWFNIS